MSTSHIPITRPVLGREEHEAVAAVLASGFLVQGPRVEEFERRVAETADRAHAVAVTNCTAALEVALLAIGIGDGDRVIVTPYSWVATANVIELCGATPVFVDVDAATFNLDATLLADRLASSDRIAAIMAVDTFGNPAGMQAIEHAAVAAGVPLVEDAACALGAVEEGRPAGSFGVAGCFSFHPRKIITTGEGGMIVTDDDDVAAYARARRNHGQAVVDGQMAFASAGQNLRLTELQGALGVCQMSRLDALVRERGELAERYDELVARVGVVPQRRSPGAAVQSYVALVPPSASAAPVIAALRAAGVEATIGTNAIPFTHHYQERYHLSDAELPVTAMLRDRAITLPLFPGMTRTEQDRVVEVLEQAVAA